MQDYPPPSQTGRQGPPTSWLTIYGMASAVQISIDEFNRTSYRPDREYIDGELRERNVGKWEHARIQALLAS